ncbi:phosphate/phosphite/phosphonate ABC transporter substrate-binding protein [Phototrophicus methaneseepsis]|uniref:Phosphate/phosphite/phosphonate ABC transporter substrate-binding protein n=1 Tax=Phototrophicus methaneseepsis TaxID=2710758 RepID=A0A7S8EDH1_9CHLR|nr:phosphate/phosphite/phosphonate ABC transporter substrate-binding protein [Phototrophicus methaneseepsis]QPC84926.1 phosphate/phosphite/phosphonate ABC transporter substrate-binding protein [Phototrophicus methaneseepsis]
MVRRISVLVLALVFVLGASVVGAQDLGTEENPIQVFFVPSAEAQTLITGGEVLAEALTEATGLSFEVSVPTSYASTIEAMCADPERSMGFIPAAGYVIGNNRCDLEVYAAAVRFGWPVYWAEYIVRRDSDIYTFADLEGRSWAYPDRGSTSGFLFPSVEMQAAGITAGEEVEAGGHGQAVLAVYNGEADFATVYFSAPLTPGGAWDYGDLPEPYDLTVEDAFVDDEGDLYVGETRILDARSAVAEQAPDVVDEVRILRLSNPIPNDTMSFGPDFPPELRDQIYDALVAFSETDAWAETALGSSEGYDWTGLEVVPDSNYDIIRLQFEILGLTEEDIFADG